MQLPAKDGESPVCRPPARTREIAIALLAITFLALHPMLRGQQSNAAEDQVKAAYLLNFAKVAEWPKTVLADGPSPLVIGVSGGDEDFLRVLRALVARKFVGTHPIEVKPVRSIEQMKSCHIVFFRASEKEHTLAAIEGIDEGVLLVGEDEFFLLRGGMINLVRDRGSIQFEVNADALDHSAIHFSAKILALAKTGFDPSRASLLNPPAEGVRGTTRRLEHNVAPEYPEIAGRMKLTGTVQAEAVVNPDGTVREVRVVGGHPLLAEAVVRAVKQWKYQLATKETVEPVKFVFGPQ